MERWEGVGSNTSANVGSGWGRVGKWQAVWALALQQIWGVGEKGVSGEVGEWSGDTLTHVGEREGGDEWGSVCSSGFSKTL